MVLAVNRSQGEPASSLEAAITTQTTWKLPKTCHITSIITRGTLSLYGKAISTALVGILSQDYDGTSPRFQHCAILSITSHPETTSHCLPQEGISKVSHRAPKVSPIAEHHLNVTRQFPQRKLASAPLQSKQNSTTRLVVHCKTT